jgi:hypothetical protein
VGSLKRNSKSSIETEVIASPGEHGNRDFASGLFLAQHVRIATIDGIHVSTTNHNSGTIYWFFWAPCNIRMLLEVTASNRRIRLRTCQKAQFSPAISEFNPTSCNPEEESQRQIPAITPSGYCSTSEAGGVRME